MKIYTKTGDGGTTGLFGGRRVEKDHQRLNAYGSIDELNAFLGLSMVHAAAPMTREVTNWLQNTLFVAGADLATPFEANSHIDRLGQEAISKAEEYIDAVVIEIPELSNFILPGGTRSAAALHVARTVCRRAEREIFTLSKTENINPNILIFVNRISDLLFVLARYENFFQHVSDVNWEK
ncbi:MAG: cob(I)yrinic acid a,c-diamide adenosyltransferase [Ignavibacteria bacterium]|nr:cob(I)yrinic acid a,c-diamide adenosyltransferase [Ignavibacteria bacterium]